MCAPAPDESQDGRYSVAPLLPVAPVLSIALEGPPSWPYGQRSLRCRLRLIVSSQLPWTRSVQRLIRARPRREILAQRAHQVFRPHAREWAALLRLLLHGGSYDVAGSVTHVLDRG